MSQAFSGKKRSCNLWGAAIIATTAAKENLRKRLSGPRAEGRPDWPVMFHLRKTRQPDCSGTRVSCHDGTGGDGVVAERSMDNGGCRILMSVETGEGARWAASVESWQ